MSSPHQQTPEDESVAIVSGMSAATCDCPECGGILGTNEFSAVVTMDKLQHCPRKVLTTDCVVCGPRKSTWLLIGGRWQLQAMNPRRKSA